VLGIADAGLGQERPTGVELGALPAIGFDADECVGLGVSAQV